MANMDMSLVLGGPEIDPMIEGMVSKPGQLALGKIPGILLYEGKHLCIRDFTLQMGEDLLVTDGSQWKEFLGVALF